MNRLLLRPTIRALIFFFISTFFLSLPAYAACKNCRKEPNQADLIAALQNDYVEVIQVGNTLKLILGVDHFFAPQSRLQVYPTRVKTLNNIARLLFMYGAPRITISGHTDNVGSDQDKLNRSLAQANVIGSYLWSTGIPLGRMTILGCGDTHPVASNRTPNGSAANRRIEIGTKNSDTTFDE